MLFLVGFVELGFCYANGKGTKKDLKLAAKYYRMAAEQGVEMMGSQWICKDKVSLSLSLFFFFFLDPLCDPHKHTHTNPDSDADVHFPLGIFF
jgi:hypothetical protein